MKKILVLLLFIHAMFAADEHSADEIVISKKVMFSKLIRVYLGDRGRFIEDVVKEKASDPEYISKIRHYCEQKGDPSDFIVSRILRALQEKDHSVAVSNFLLLEGKNEYQEIRDIQKKIDDLTKKL